MRLVLLCIAMCLLATSISGMPQGHETPVTYPPHLQNQIDEFMCEVFNRNCKNTSESPQPQPDQPQLQVQPDSATEENPSESCRCVYYFKCDSSKSDKGAVKSTSFARRNVTKCPSYLHKCCRPENIIETRPTKPSITAKPCGKRNYEGIGSRYVKVTDSQAQYGEFPWMVAVATQETPNSNFFYVGGGSLIHPQVVLTAAHRLKRKKNLSVRIGEWNTQTKDEQFPTQRRYVDQVIIHEQFAPDHEPLAEDAALNDVALLILDRPVDMSLPNVGLICLPEAGEDMDSRNCVASGWGKDGVKGKYQAILKKIDGLPMVPRSRCEGALRQTFLGKNFTLHESFVCAGGIKGKDTCKGDGGGPLVCPSKNDPDVYVQAGIVAWGNGCGTATPGVYVNVPHLVNWIEKTLQAQRVL